jgi:hypothetical protein
VQHELIPSVSVTAGYYRRRFYNLDVIDNTTISKDDWTPFTITTPTDTRLALSGQPITLYNLNNNKVGVATDNLRTFSTLNSTTYNGFEVSANLRKSKLLMFGGITVERRAVIDCDGTTTASNSSTALSTSRDNPNALRFCDSIPPFRTTGKVSAAYQLPYDVQLSGSFLAVPGSSVSAFYTVTSAIANRTIVASTAGATTMPVNLIESNTQFLDYRKTLDLRVARTFRFGKSRIQGFADIFNLFNAGTVVRVNEIYGSNPATNAWLTPLTLIDARYVRFGTQLSF